MFKKSIIFTMFMFVALIIVQLIFRSEIVWLDIIGISIFIFLFHMLFEWIDKRKS